MHAHMLPGYSLGRPCYCCGKRCVRLMSQVLCRKTPKRLEGDPAARIATEAARLMRQQGGAAPGGAAMVTSSSSSASAPEERLQEEAPPDVWGDSFILDMPSMEQALPDSDPADAPSSSRCAPNCGLLRILDCSGRLTRSLP